MPGVLLAHVSGYRVLLLLAASALLLRQTVSPVDQAHRLPDLRIGEVKVMLPVRAVSGGLPAAIDALAIAGERAREPLREFQRGEVRRISHERPHAVAELHRIHAGDASRVEVVLTVCLAAGIDADDGDAVRSFGDFGALHHELPVQHPLEDGAAGDRGRSSRKRCFHGPLADEHLQALHRGTPPWHVYRIEPRSATVVLATDPGGLT